MKRFALSSITLVFICCFIACGNEQDSENMDSENDGYGIVEEDSVGSFVPPPLPEKTAARDSIEKVVSALSPFQKLGCCDDSEQWGDDCCCDEIMTVYREMKKNKDPKLGEYKSTDPILGTCREKHAKKFAEIDKEFRKKRDLD